ncbi:hypothetical protein B296_00029409 [Ensete ventricosum]|uniref:Uncharacterized protein n=1 Tax=Ensete ventricosum TaxID=4639 RepID=A0A426XRT7_ENSVE|nr:hypothetical protein B296_00029409 [Ensete ventricosum]
MFRTYILKLDTTLLELLLDDSLGSMSQHDVVRPAHARPAKQGAELGEGMRRLLSPQRRDDQGPSPSFRGQAPARKDIPVGWGVRGGGRDLPTRSL